MVFSTDTTVHSDYMWSTNQWPLCPDSVRCYNKFKSPWNWSSWLWNASSLVIYNNL